MRGTVREGAVSRSRAAGWRWSMNLPSTFILVLLAADAAAGAAAAAAACDGVLQLLPAWSPSPSRAHVQNFVSFTTQSDNLKKLLPTQSMLVFEHSTGLGDNN